MIRKTIILVIALLITISLSPARAADGNMGTTVKVPYPMGVRGVTLEKQKVDITVYSTFIKVEGDYVVGNTGDYPVTATFGFPIYRHGGGMEKGEYPPISLQVLMGKKDGDCFVNRKIEGDPDADGPYKEWYLWQVDIAARRNSRFKVVYYLRLSRNKGVPSFTCALQQTKAYEGVVGFTDLDVNMPLDCKDLMFLSAPDYSGRSFLHTSLARPKIQKNLLSWSFKDHLPLDDLTISFYKNGYPDWQAEGSCGTTPEGIFDGNFSTCWMSLPDNGGVGSYLLLKPVVRDIKGNVRPFDAQVKEIGIIPGNMKTISDFYNFSHLKEGHVEVFLKDGDLTDKTSEEKVKKPVKTDRMRQAQPADMPLDIAPAEAQKAREMKKELPDVIMIDASADPTLQFFSSKKPLTAKDGPLKMVMSMVYQGQLRKELCISEILIFDREPGQIYEY